MSKSAYRLVLAGLAVLVLAATAVITVQRVSPYPAAVLIIALATAPFLISFERSRPDAREVVLMAVLTALAVASRSAFALASAWVTVWIASNAMFSPPFLHTK